MLVFACPSCSAKLQMADALAGTKVRCASCQAVITAPEQGETTDAIKAVPGSAPVPAPAEVPFAVTSAENVPAAPPPAERKGRDDTQDDDSERDDRDDIKRRGPRRDGSSAAAVGAGLGAGAVVAIVLGVGLCVVIPCLIALLVPAVQKVREAAARTQSQNNLKQFALACHSHHDTFKTLPPPKHMNPQGMQPVDLSWRVSVLPFVEQNFLFGRFDQTVAWDKMPNQQLMSPMPDLYWDPVFDTQKGGTTTVYQYFTGPNTLWPDSVTKRRIFDITDGTSNTFMIAEAASPVPWTKPADMAIQPGQPLPLPPDRFIVAMADGSTRVVFRRNAPDAALRLYIDPTDGNPVPDID